MKEFYKRALTIAENARKEIEQINEDFAYSEKFNRTALNEGRITKKGYDEAMQGLAEERDRRISAKVSGIEALRQEFDNAMQDASRIDGGQIDESTMRLLNSGVKLSTGEWQRMIDANKDNATMLRIIKQKYDERPIKKDGMPAGFFDMSGKRQSAEEKVNFPISPEEKARAFDSFCGIVSRGAVSGAKLSEFPTQNDYWNSVARSDLNKLGESLDDGEFAFEVYEKPKPTVW